MAAPEFEKTGSSGQDHEEAALTETGASTAHDVSEISEYMQEVGGKANSISHIGTTMLQSNDDQKVSISLPLDQEQIEKGLHHKIGDAVFWLAVFCKRLAKKAAALGIKILYPRMN